MKKIIRVILSYIISIIPINKMKIFLYNILFGYKIDYSCKIGFFNLIVCKNFKMDKKSSIGNLNHITLWGGD